MRFLKTTLKSYFPLEAFPSQGNTCHFETHCVFSFKTWKLKSVLFTSSKSLRILRLLLNFAGTSIPRAANYVLIIPLWTHFFPFTVSMVWTTLGFFVFNFFSWSRNTLSKWKFGAVIASTHDVEKSSYSCLHNLNYSSLREAKKWLIC